MFSIKRLIAAALALAAILSAACTQSEVRTFSNQIDRLGIGISAAIDVKQNLRAKGKLDAEDDIKVSEYLLRLDRADKKLKAKADELRARLAALEKEAKEKGERFDPTRYTDNMKSELRPFVQDVISLIRDAQDVGLLGVKNEESKAALQSALADADTIAQSLLGVLL